MPFLTQGKTNWKYMVILLILAVIVGGGIFYYLKFPEVKFPPKPEKYSCNTDTDCAIRRVDCSGCSFNLACINKKWVHCELSPPPGESCSPPVPSPSWPRSCECVNSKCIAKEVIGETANWKIYNSPDNILQARVIPVGKTKESIVEIWTNEGKLLQRENYTSEDGDHGLVLAQAEWTPDSQFFIYSMYSSGGHQPWFSRVYFYSRPNNKIYYFSKVSGFTVASDKFTVTTPDIVMFTVYTSVGMGPTITKSFKLSDIISTLNWKTYRNEEIGVEFKYSEEIFANPYIGWERDDSIGIIFSKEKNDPREYTGLYFTAYTPDYEIIPPGFGVFTGAEDITSHCPEPLKLNLSDTTGGMCKIIEVAGQKAIFNTFASNYECSPSFWIYVYFNNQGDSSYRGLVFTLMRLDVEKEILRFMPDCLGEGDQEKFESDFYTQSMNIMENKNLSEKDREKLEAFNQMLSTFRFLE